eukprot:CAMPEP_0170317796 /NCGR_PEP_ID=MMETSP0116_2-20130129/59575_1 /TAXON_ID=400756 /ORGANISM="Durinskia baltica, Strain CSIRO CS-38" /LENGTH=190 /DNA_ID=CAMNT_0010570453 /DNA_START=213 /DNA_END=783 /DNA_ORIENTATION=-
MYWPAPHRSSEIGDGQAPSAGLARRQGVEIMAPCWHGHGPGIRGVQRQFVLPAVACGRDLNRFAIRREAQRRLVAKRAATTEAPTVRVDGTCKFDMARRRHLQSGLGAATHDLVVDDEPLQRLGALGGGSQEDKARRSMEGATFASMAVFLHSTDQAKNTPNTVCGNAATDDNVPTANSFGIAGFGGELE